MARETPSATKLSNLVVRESDDRRSHIEADRDPILVHERSDDRIHDPSLYRRDAAVGSREFIWP